MILWVLYGLERLGDTSPPSRIPLTSGCCLNLWNSWYGLLQYQEFLVRARGVRRALPHRRYLPRSTVIYLAPQAPKQCVSMVVAGLGKHCAVGSIVTMRYYMPIGISVRAARLRASSNVPMRLRSTVQALGDDTAGRREQWQMPRVPNR